MADAIDVLLQAANASKERRQATIDTQNKTTDTMINAFQKNRQLDIMQQTANVGMSELDIKREQLNLEKQKAERMLDFENIINLGKLRDVAKSSKNESLLNSVDTQLNALTGNKTDPNNFVDPQAVQPVANQSDPMSSIQGIQAPELDKFNDKLTTKGLQQEAINKQIEAQGLEQAKTEAKNKEKIKGMETIEGDLDSLLSLYNKIPSEDKGPIEGRTRGVFAKAFGTDVPLTTFEDSSGLVLANISREFGGEKGVLTDQDIKRIKSAFPNKTDTDDIAKAKIDFIKDFVRRKIDVKKSGVSGKTDLSSMSTEELKKLAGV